MTQSWAHTGTLILLGAGLVASCGDDSTSASNGDPATDAMVSDLGDAGVTDSTVAVDTGPVLDVGDVSDAASALDADFSDALDQAANEDIPDALGSDGDLGNTDMTTTLPFELVRRWPTEAYSAPVFADCLLASPLEYVNTDGDTEIIQAGGDVVVGLDPTTGEVLWQVALWEPEGTRAFVAATPALSGDLLAVGYQTYASSDTTTVLEPETTAISYPNRRMGHYVAVIDLVNAELAADFPVVELEASLQSPNEAEMIEFLPDHAFGRSEILWVGQTEESRGLVYVSFGNIRDIQPWHGWMFELDLDAWSEDDANAISSVLTTTAESDCGSSGASGSTQRICGGGLWSPSGSLSVESDIPGEFTLILAPGNGQLDLARQDYANTLLRTSAGLAVDPGCNVDACADFDADAPAAECIESCPNLFVPRPRAGEGPPRPENGICDGLEFFECWQELDYIGGSTPVHVPLANELSVLAYPTKDGHLYLVDYDHLGTMYDRYQMVDYCGDLVDNCWWSWAGMAVTQPVVTSLGGTPLIITATFMPDVVHDGGLVALTVEIEEGLPVLAPAWEFPSFGTEEATTRFRRHPSRPTLHTYGENELLWIVDTSAPGGLGTLTVVATKDGSLVAEAPLAGPGMRFTEPLVIDDVVYINTCSADAGPGTLEAFEITGE